MKAKVIYVVKQERGIGPDRTVDIISAFRKREEAEVCASKADIEYIIPRKDLFNIIPEDIYLNWPIHPIEEDSTSINDDLDVWSDYDEEYNGYTLSQYISQYVRCAIFAEDCKPCEIEEVDLF